MCTCVRLPWLTWVCVLLVLRQPLFTLYTDFFVFSSTCSFQFDEVQLLANEAAQVYKSTWVFGRKVAGGTLEIRMNAERSKLIVLGEGYKQLNLPSADGWVVIAKDIPKDTE